MNAAETTQVKVVQFVESWLPKTMTWLYGHLQALPAEVDSNVVCQWTDNLDQFPQEKIFSLEQPSRQANHLQMRLRRFDHWDPRRRHTSFLQKQICDLKAGLLHSHFGHYGWFNRNVARKCGVPHIVSFYGYDVTYLPQNNSRWFARYRKMSDLVDLVLCEGPYMAKSIAALGVDADKIQIFRLGINLATIPFVARPNPGEGVKRFLIAGSFREKKGIPWALEAIGRFSQRHPQIEITVIGNAESELEGREQKVIMEKVARWNLGGKTTFMGFQPHQVLIDEFYKHDVFISPSVKSVLGDTEGGAPVTIIEAAASGMPIVSTLHCDIPFVLSSANRAFLAPERDADGLVDALERLFATKDWNSITSANRHLVEAELNVEVQAHKLGAIYKKLASDARQRVA